MIEPSKQAKEAGYQAIADLSGNQSEFLESVLKPQLEVALQAAYAIDYPALLEQARSEVEGEVRKRFNAEALKRGIRFAASIEELLDAALSPEEDTCNCESCQTQRLGPAPDRTPKEDNRA